MRKPLIHAALLIVLAAPAVNTVLAQGTGTYPDRPLRLIVPFPPGGGNDILGRAVGQRLTQVLGQQIVVDNRGGAGGALGATIAANATPDGYTLFLGSLGSLVLNPVLKKNLSYKPIRDFAPISLLATSPFILAVNPGVPAKSVLELVALAKKNPGKLNFASAGTGSSLHLVGEIFKHATGTDIVHVPYKGTGPALTDVIGGRVQLIFSTIAPALPHIRAGRLRALGVTTAKRAAVAPDVPTIAESGVKGFSVSNWQGILVPGKTPAAIVRKLNHDVLATLELPGMSEVLHAQGLDPAGGTSAEFTALIKEETAKYSQVVKSAGIHVE